VVVVSIGAKHLLKPSTWPVGLDAAPDSRQRSHRPTDWST